MPSGSRKRKAAKKKQGKFTHSSANPTAVTTSSTHGDDDSKHHESDGDYKSDGEEGVVKATEDAKHGDVQVEKEAGQEDGAVHVEEESNTGNGFDQKRGDSSSSSSSSDSDDDSLKVEKNKIVKNAPVIDLVEGEHPVSELPVEVTHTPLVTKLDDPEAQCVSEVVGENIPALGENVLAEADASADSSVSPNVVERAHEENEDTNLTSPVESTRLPEITKELPPEDQKESGVAENATKIDLVEAEHPVSELPAELTHTPSVTKLDDSVAECISEVVEENISVLDERVFVESGASADSSTSPGVVELGHEENGEAYMSSPEESARQPEVTKELAPADRKESGVVENAPEIDLVEAELVSELPVEVSHTPLVTKLDDSVAECISEVVEENISVLDERVLVESGSAADISTNSGVVEFGHEENGEAYMSSPEESPRQAEVAKEMAPEGQKQSGTAENAPEMNLVEEEHIVSKLPFEVTHTPLVTKLDDSVAECVSEVVEENISVLDEKVLVESGASGDSSSSPGVVELRHEENGNVCMSSPEESARVPEVTKELAPEVQKELGVVENEPELDLVEEKHLVSELPLEVTHTPLVTKLVLSDKLPVVSVAPADSSSSHDVVELGQKGNGEGKLSSPVGSARLSEVTKEQALENQKDEENASPLEVAKEMAPEDKKNEIIDVAATSEIVVHSNEEKLVLSYNAPSVDTTEDVKESEITGSVDSQAHVTSTIRPDQATSWKCCCGLFEAFAGTSR